MKTIEGFKMRSLGKDYIIMGEGASQVNFNKMLSLNETATFLWKEVQGKDFTPEDMVTLLTDHYEVTRERARQDIDNLLKVWQEQGVIE